MTRRCSGEHDACRFPIAGALAFITAGLISRLLDDGRMGFFMMVMAALLPGIVAFLVGLELEKKLAGPRFYLNIRHGLQIAGFAFMGHVMLMAVLGSGSGSGSGDSAGTCLFCGLLVVASGVAGPSICRRMDGDSPRP